MLTAGFLTTANLRARILPPEYADDTQFDTALATIGLGVAALFEAMTARKLSRSTSATFETPADAISIILDRYPVESISAIVRLADNGDSSESISDLIDSLDKKSGVIHFSNKIGTWQEVIKVTFTGGYWLDDGNSQPAGSTALPADLLMAYTLQCQAVAEHNNLARSRAVRLEADDTRAPSLRTLDILPTVKETLDRYRRLA